jgi:adenosylmethionine-8-amino-7-oxononanoate aminotransferase
MSEVLADLETIRDYDNRYYLHPWEALDAIGSQNRTIAGSAEGIYVTDEAGHRLIDGPGGMWCVQIGYGRREMADAIAEQVVKMTYNSPWSIANEPAARLARKVAELAPGDLDHVFFTCGGSTAVDSALRFVQFYNNVLGRPEKKLIISRLNAYHGSTYLAASCNGKTGDRGHFDFADEVIRILPDVNPYRRPEGQSLEDFLDEKVGDLERMIREMGPDKVAAFIAEPLLASGGVIVPPPGYHKRCLEVCRAHDVLYISDEVVTGFGRLGHWFASEAVFDIEPDIITCAKGLTSCYLPLGACIISDRVFTRISGGKAEKAVFANGFTYSGHPVCCAAALKNIEIIEREGILEHVRDVSPHFLGALEALREIPIVGDVRGVGLVGCVECDLGAEGEQSETVSKEIGKLVDRHCQSLGLIVRPMMNMNVFSPPLIITRGEIDRMMEILAEGIRRTMEDLRAQGLWQG